MLASLVLTREQAHVQKSHRLSRKTEIPLERHLR